MVFARNLRLARKALGLSTKDIAAKLGVSRSYITLIENNDRLPGKHLLAKIAKILHLEKEKVIEWYLEDMKSKLK